MKRYLLDLPPSDALQVGNVYYVVQTTDAFYSQFVEDHQRTYSDGSQAICPHTGTSSTVTVNGIKAALAKCVANRNDYVVVMPSDTNYCIDEALAMDKKAVHLICPAGMGVDFPIGNTARIKQITAATAVIAMTAQACEVAGLYLKNYASVATITLSADALSPNIHHNAFMLVWTTAPNGAIVGTGAGGGWGTISHNWFISESGNAQTCALGVIQIDAGATGCRVCHNEITIGDANIATIAISNQAVKGHVDFNIFSESGGTGAGASGGTITKCISIGVYGCAIGNMGAVTAGKLLTGGTSAQRAVANYEAAATSAIL